MLIPYGVLADQSSNTSVSSFAYAFQHAGLHWAAYVVSACASLGIITNVGISAPQPLTFDRLFSSPHASGEWCPPINERQAS